MARSPSCRSERRILKDRRASDNRTRTSHARRRAFAWDGPIPYSTVAPDSFTTCADYSVPARGNAANPAGDLLVTA
jgi:hypothetical protein